MTNKKEIEQVMGIVVEAYPDTRFKIELDEGGEMQAYLSGKMRKFRIRILIGDRVLIDVDSYGGKGRIVRRL